MDSVSLIAEGMRNVYENFLLTAMKFHINVDKLCIGQRANSSAKYFMSKLLPSPVDSAQCVCTGVVVKCGTSFYHAAKTSFLKLVHLRHYSGSCVSVNVCVSVCACVCVCECVCVCVCVTVCVVT